MTETPAAAGPEDRKFADLSKRWLDETLRLNPIGATTTGDHRYDSEVGDYSAAGRAQRYAMTKAVLGDLEAIDRGKLTRDNQVDAAILENQLRGDLWQVDALKDYAWDPLGYSYLAGGALNGLFAREFAPLPNRLRSAMDRMEKLPSIFAAARENLVPARVPDIHATTYSNQNKGLNSLVDEMAAQAGALPEGERPRMAAAAAKLKAAIAEHQAWIDGALVPNAKGDFRIGAALYDQKLRYTLNSTLSRAEIRQRADAAFQAMRNEMYGLAKTVLNGRAGAPVGSLRMMCPNGASLLPDRTLNCCGPGCSAGDVQADVADGTRASHFRTKA